MTISSELNSVRHYAQFVRTSEAALQKLDESVGAIAKTLSTHDEASKSLLIRTNDCESRLESTIASLDDKVKKYASAELDKENEELKCRLATIEDDSKTLFAAHETLAKHFTKRLDSCSADAEQNNYVRWKEFNQTVQEMKEIIHMKVTSKSIEDVKNQVKRIEAELNVTTKKTELAKQFIDWYSYANQK